MEYFHSIKDSDIFENPLPEPVEYIDRPTVKGLVFDSEGKIPLLFGNGYGLFPGGGIEEGEVSEEAFIRECKEEIGCNIEIVSKIGTAVQFRAKQQRRYVVDFFVAKVVNEKGVPTTDQVDELACEVKWLSPEEVRKSFLELINWLPQDEYYQTNFNSRTHLAALEKYLEMKK
jgi:ADP-ribose pyrophosphatase YjhB (NUDIX family)